MIGSELIVDSFAGGGGASLGIARALGRSPDVAINHNAPAIAMHAANHPDTKHLIEDVWRVNPRSATKGRPVGLLWTSPDCKHFSRAKGGKPVEKSIRGLAWVAIKWAVEVRPRVIVLENVREFEDWGPLLPMWQCKGCDWKGTEGQARLARRTRRCPRCDAAGLKEMDSKIPDPKRKGLTFRRFTGRLRNLGYRVEHRTLNAADYGAPTHRRRLFLIARRDGLPVVWPEPTHGDPKKIAAQAGGLFGCDLKPWRTAAECIDWSIPCPSIFDRKRPLAEKTLKRIALGIKRYVLDNPTPFIVDMHRDNRSRGVDEPMGTMTTQGNRYNVVSPIVVPTTHAGERRAHPPGEPLPTITGANRGEHAVISPLLTRIGQSNGKGKYANGIGEPVTTITSKAEHCLIAPVISQLSHGGKGTFGDSRSKDVRDPLGTIHAGGGNHAIVAAFIARHFGKSVGASTGEPLGTVMPGGKGKTGIVAANLVHLNHGDKTASAVDEPARTVTATGNHAALVYSFLVKYFGTAVGTPLDLPLPTITGKDRFGLVTVSIDGEPYVIVDIGMRMLRPRELARAQGFPDSYILTGTATSQVERIGNSVCPQVAEAIVRANFATAGETAVSA